MTQAFGLPWLHLDTDVARAIFHELVDGGPGDLVGIDEALGGWAPQSSPAGPEVGSAEGGVGDVVFVPERTGAGRFRSHSVAHDGFQVARYLDHLRPLVLVRFHTRECQLQHRFHSLARVRPHPRIHLVPERPVPHSILYLNHPIQATS